MCTDIYLSFFFLNVENIRRLPIIKIHAKNENHFRHYPTRHKMWETANYKKYEEFIAPYFHFLEYISKIYTAIIAWNKKYVSH